MTQKCTLVLILGSICAIGLLSPVVRATPVRQGQAQATAEAELPKEDFQTLVTRHSLAGVWTRTASSDILGFIGDDCRRLRVHFASVAKDPRSPANYLVNGKTQVNGVVRDFHGTIVVQTVRKYEAPELADDDKERGIAQFELSARYLFRQNPQLPATGIFEGKLSAGFYTDRLGKVRYDDIEGASDGFSNNEFVGVWRSYKGNIAKKCNWGDYRIPDSGDLDIGAGVFVPNEKYLQNGWQSFQLDEEHHLIVEMREWWK